MQNHLQGVEQHSMATGCGQCPSRVESEWFVEALYLYDSHSDDAVKKLTAWRNITSATGCPETFIGSSLFATSHNITIIKLPDNHILNESNG